MTCLKTPSAVLRVIICDWIDKLDPQVLVPGGLLVRRQEVDRGLRAEGAGDRRGRAVLRHGRRDAADRRAGQRLQRLEEALQVVQEVPQGQFASRSLHF